MVQFWEDFPTILGPFWDQLGTILGSSWDHFGIILGSFWDHLGTILGQFWDHLGIILGPSWDHFGIILGSSWDNCGTILGSIWDNIGIISGDWDSISETWGSEGVKVHKNKLVGSLFKSHFEDLSVLPFLGLLGVLFSLLFWSTETFSRKDSQRRSARRASGGFPSRRELNFHFCNLTEKGLKKESKTERVGSQSPHYTPFWSPTYRK